MENAPEITVLGFKNPAADSCLKNVSAVYNRNIVKRNEPGLLLRAELNNQLGQANQDLDRFLARKQKLNPDVKNSKHVDVI